MKTLIWALEESVKKNGECPLTNRWLLNLLKLAQREDERRYVAHEAMMNEVEERIYMEEAGDR